MPSRNQEGNASGSTTSPGNQATAGDNSAQQINEPFVLPQQYEAARLPNSFAFAQFFRPRVKKANLKSSDNAQRSGGSAPPNGDSDSSKEVATQSTGATEAAAAEPPAPNRGIAKEGHATFISEELAAKGRRHLMAKHRAFGSHLTLVGSLTLSSSDEDVLIALLSIAAVKIRRHEYEAQTSPHLLDRTPRKCLDESKQSGIVIGLEFDRREIAKHLGWGLNKASYTAILESLKRLGSARFKEPGKSEEPGDTPFSTTRILGFPEDLDLQWQPKPTAETARKVDLDAKVDLDGKNDPDAKVDLDGKLSLDGKVDLDVKVILDGKINLHLKVMPKGKINIDRTVNLHGKANLHGQVCLGGKVDPKEKVKVKVKALLNHKKGPRATAGKAEVILCRHLSDIVLQADTKVPYGLHLMSERKELSPLGRSLYTQLVAQVRPGAQGKIHLDTLLRKVSGVFPTKIQRSTALKILTVDWLANHKWVITTVGRAEHVYLTVNRPQLPDRVKSRLPKTVNSKTPDTGATANATSSENASKSEHKPV